jgi:hypothetical protein
MKTSIIQRRKLTRFLHPDLDEKERYDAVHTRDRDFYVSYERSRNYDKTRGASPAGHASLEKIFSDSDGLAKSFKDATPPKEAKQL